MMKTVTGHGRRYPKKRCSLSTGERQRFKEGPAEPPSKGSGWARAKGAWSPDKNRNFMRCAGMKWNYHAIARRVSSRLDLDAGQNGPKVSVVSLNVKTKGIP